MVLPTGDSHHPAVTRVQQQHNVFRGAHQHSASDPSALRDAATLALLSNQAVFAQATHGMYPPIHPGLYNQFYGTPESYPSELAVAAMASRLQTHFTSPYGVLPAQGLGVDHSNTGSESPLQNSGGPSANNRKLGLYKTELCRSWEEKGSCRYGAKCQFAHGEDELRNVARHPKVSTHRRLQY
jgi:tristetraprolin